MSFSENTQNVGLAVATKNHLRSFPIAALEDGERASVAGVLYRLDKASLAADDNVNVLAARPAIVSFSPLVVDPLIPGRWLLDVSPAPPGSGLAVDYQDVLVNGQTIFNLPALPAGDLVMQVNGVTYPEVVSWTRAGLVVTWLNVPFPLFAGDQITFIA
jgi:hypothetical protein